LIESQQEDPDDEVCAKHLAEQRWAKIAVSMADSGKKNLANASQKLV
jgi:hypothetical protein